MNTIRNTEVQVATDCYYWHEVVDCEDFSKDAKALDKSQPHLVRKRTGTVRMPKGKCPGCGCSYGDRRFRISQKAFRQPLIVADCKCGHIEGWIYRGILGVDGAKEEIRKRTNLRDVQQQRLYNWENALHLGNLSGELETGRVKDREKAGATLTDDKIYDLVKEICEAEKMSKITEVRFTNKAYHCFARVGLNEITLTNTRGRKRWTVVHEMAHIIDHVRLSRKDPKYSAQGHGPSFVATYCELLAEHCGYDRLGLIASAKAFGLKVEEN